MHNLSSILRSIVTDDSQQNCQRCTEKLAAIEKIIMFDLSLTIDTYIHSLVAEVKRSHDELERYSSSLEDVIAERTRLLKVQARQDGLTQLLNQHSFYEELRKELSRGRRRNHSTVLVYFDLDGFKALNDAYGHKRGDEILVAVATAMKSALRAGEIAARYGGDEFCIILPESSILEAQQLCQRLTDVLRKAVGDHGVSCSIGIAISNPDNKLDANTLVKMADRAMYQAKLEEGFTIRMAGELFGVA